jgi:uncharacterized protein YndB with AHSA1/START domain
MPRAKTCDIRLSAFVRAEPEQAYHALTSARELCVWWLDRAETEARSMGRLRMVWPTGSSGGGNVATGVFVDLEPGRKVAWMWDSPPRPRWVPSLVTFHIEARPRGCELTLVHSGFSAAPSRRKGFLACRDGWEDCMAKLRLYLESGKTCKCDRLTLADVDPRRRKRG